MTDPARAKLRERLLEIAEHLRRGDECPHDSADCQWQKDARDVEEAISRLGEPEAPAPQPKVDKHKAGLYRKFDVRRTDGSDAPNGKHYQCCYYVLDITHDPFAIPALKAYAKACRGEYPNLATDLDSLVKGNPLMPYRTQMPPGPRSLMEPAESPVSAREPEVPADATETSENCPLPSVTNMDRRLLELASRMFNSVADLRMEEHRRINDWLKQQMTLCQRCKHCGQHVGSDMHYAGTIDSHPFELETTDASQLVTPTESLVSGGTPALVAGLRKMMTEHAKEMTSAEFWLLSDAAFTLEASSEALSHALKADASPLVTPRRCQTHGPIPGLRYCPECASSGEPWTDAQADAAEVILPNPTPDRRTAE